MYLLRCADSSYYAGSTRSLDKRVWEHNAGLGAEYTRHRLPVELVYAEEYERIDDAFGREKQVQGWSRRKRELLIAGEYGELPNASKKVWRRPALPVVE
jgi:putative endonuclease